MPNYDALLYEPLAPVAEVIIRDFISGASVPGVLLQIDSGSDITLLPRSAVERLGTKLASNFTYELMTFDGTKSDAKPLNWT